MTSTEYSPDSISKYRGADSYDRKSGMFTWLLDNLGREALKDLSVVGGQYEEKRLVTASGDMPSAEQYEAYQRYLSEIASPTVHQVAANDNLYL